MTGLALALSVALLGQAGAPAFDAESIELAGEVLGLSTVDHDGDGKVDLLVAREDGLELLALRADANGARATIGKLPRGSARTLAWCVAPADPPAAGGAPRRQAVYLARDDGAVLRWEPGREPVELARATTLLLPGGVLAFPFARDLDGDGRSDVALPELSGLRLWFQNADGTLRKGPQVRHRVDVQLNLPSPDETRPEVAVSLTVPAFKAEDENGDGVPDLAFESKERLQFFWSVNGALPETPTFEVDLDELKRKMPSDDQGIFDPGNLFKLIATLVNADVRDLDGDGLADLLLQQGPKVSLFAGTRGGIDRTKAAQVLKTSGNLIAAFCADDSGDGKLDLNMLQAADISIGDVLLWVVVGGELKLDLFTYFQEERLHFAKHPSRRRRIVIKVPAILSLAADLKENDALKRMGEDLARVPVELDLDGDGKRDDLGVLRRDGVVDLYPGAAPPARGDEEEVWRAVTERFDREARGKDEVTIKLLDVVDWLPLVGGRRRAAVAGHTPAGSVGTPDVVAPPNPPEGDAKNAELPATRRMVVVLDVDGDRKDDLLLVDPGDNTHPVRIDLFRTR